MKPQFSFRSTLLLRVGLYVAGTVLAYHMVRLAATQMGLNYAIGSFFELRFLLIWGYFLVVYLVVKHVFSHFDRQMILSWLLGELHQPSQEDRIFLFMDLNDSTRIAEKIGSRQYFYFLNDFHSLVEEHIRPFGGEIFQYVGDEVVISWKSESALNNRHAIEFFFKIYEMLDQHEESFLNKYGYRPFVKGAVHLGEVTKGQMGRIKKDFAFVGDVLNTTARMYKLCNKDQAPLVISEKLLNNLGPIEEYQKQSLGHFQLEGKSDQIYVYALANKTH